MTLFKALFTVEFWSDQERSRSSPIALALLWLFILFGMLRGWVWVLDSFTLTLHEAGHPVVGIFSNRLAVYGGTLFQLAFPFAALWSFARSGQFSGFVFSCCWLGASARNVGVYCADARAMALPLIGGIDPELGHGHDWNAILGRWGALDADTLLGSLFQLSGYALMALAAALILWSWRHPARDDTLPRF